MEPFHETLTTQASKVESGKLEDELVRDLFSSKMKITLLQDTLTFEIFTPDEVFKRALKVEQSKQTTQAFQKSYANTASAGHFSGSQAKIKIGTYYGGWQ